MSGNVIATLLDDLAEQRAEVARIDSAITAKAGKLVQQRADAERQAKELETKVKEKARFIADSQAHTLVGRILQLVWSPPKPVLDEDRAVALLYELGATEQQVRALYGEKPGVWSIRVRAKSK